jgi:hypothetical protein
MVSFSIEIELHCKKTSAFHQEFHQPGLMEFLMFSPAWMFSAAQTGGFFNSVGT